MIGETNLKNIWLQTIASRDYDYDHRNEEWNAIFHCISDALYEMGVVNRRNYRIFN